MAAASLALASFGSVALAAPGPWQLNMERGSSTWSHVPYNLNNISLAVCTVIGVLVFGAMFVAMFRFRKSRGAVAEKWSHNTMVEVVWTTIPVLILVTLAYLATGGLTSWADTTGSQMTVKVTGYQWKWRYDYVDYMGKAIDKVGFMSKLDSQSDQTRQLGSGMDPYAVKVGDPLLLGPGGRLEARCDSRDHQRRVGELHHARHLSRPVRRVVRPGPWLHADRGGGEVQGGLRQMAGRAGDAVRCACRRAANRTDRHSGRRQAGLSPRGSPSSPHTIRSRIHISG